MGFNFPLKKLHFTLLIPLLLVCITQRKWIEDSYQFWDDIRLTPEASSAGVTQLSGYLFSNIHKSVVHVSYQNNPHVYNLKCTFIESLHRKLGTTISKGN